MWVRKVRKACILVEPKTFYDFMILGVVEFTVCIRKWKSAPLHLQLF